MHQFKSFNAPYETIIPETTKAPEVSDADNDLVCWKTIESTSAAAMQMQSIAIEILCEKHFHSERVLPMRYIKGEAAANVYTACFLTDVETCLDTYNWFYCNNELNIKSIT